MIRLIPGLFFCLLCIAGVQAGDYNHHWISQSEGPTGLNFNHIVDEYPEVPDFKENTRRSRAVISDQQGNLALYLGWDGTVYNDNNSPIIKADELSIDNNNSYGSIFFPAPGEKGMFYLAYSSEDEEEFYYALFNAREDEVIEKEELLAEDLYAWSTQVVKSTDGNIWLLAKNEGSRELHTFKFADQFGPEEHKINRLPSTSYRDVKGPFLTVTPDGERVATRIYNTDKDPTKTFLTLADFDSFTGDIRNVQTVDTFRFGKTIRSLAFSPKGKKLYVNTSQGSKKTLTQYNLEKPTERRVQKSSTTLFERERLRWGDFALMPGPDGKIYFSRAEYLKSGDKDPTVTRSKGVINDPEERSFGANISPHPYALKGRPPHIPVGIMKTGHIRLEHYRADEQNKIRLSNLSHEPENTTFSIYQHGRPVESLGSNQRFSFPGPGEYRVEAVVDFGNSTRIIAQKVNIFLQGVEDP